LGFFVFGGVALGVIAVGGLSLGAYFAAGGLAISLVYAIGALALAPHAIGTTGTDPEVLRVIEKIWPNIRNMIDNP
jgi:hypothetical protein